MRIPDEELVRLKREIDLAALVRSKGIELKRHGSKDLIGCCPFHPDQSNPNLIVTPEKGLFHCMVCGAAGSVIDFVMKHEGLSFRHAVEVLRDGQAIRVLRSNTPVKQATVPVLGCPLELEADDVALMNQALGYYRERLQETPAALDYLKSRGIEAAIEPFGLGFSDRTLGLRMPHKNRQDGEVLRTRLTKLGLIRESGHEHFNGCVVFPIQNEKRQVTEIYGRKINDNLRPGTAYHLYLPGPHVGIFNRECLSSPEIILCEAVVDALTFWVNGMKNVTCIYGTEGFTEELLTALRDHKTQRVYLAYDRDEAGDRAAERDSEKLGRLGIECFRVKFPHGMDANEYARKVTPPDKSLRLLLNGAEWNATSSPQDTRASSLLSLAANSLVAEPLDVRDASQPAGPLGAGLACAAKEEKGPCLEQRGEAWFLDLEGREYRVTGLEKTLGTESLKVVLRLQRVGPGSSWFHLDQVDLARDIERRRFIERAAEETGLTVDLLKRDLGKLLLAVEQAQADCLAAESLPEKPLVVLTPEEREEALAWLKAPNLMGRLREAFCKSGIIGEEANTLVAYLACVSRKLERPLAVIIQSASAAGKTTLMEAVLSFFPEEERVKYSAMTGQSLYYLGETSLKHKILAVVEEAGAEKASYALKLLQSEGELTIASTGKDPQTGKMVTQEYHVEGPVMIFLTTTAIDLDEELQNRCLTLAVDETSEQTARIHQVQRERRTLAGLVARQERKELLKKLRNAQRLLQPMDVLNPYAPELTFATGRTRNRRDHEKYLTLIDAIALLHQHQREKKSLPGGPVGACYIEVTLEDIALANELAPEVLARSLDELPPQTRRLLGYIRELLAKKREGTTTAGAGSMNISGPATFSRKELREQCGWSLTQVTVHLERLVALEYLALRHGRLGSQFLYEALFDLHTPESVAHIGLLEVEKLGQVSGFSPGVSGENGSVTGGNQTGPLPSSRLNGSALDLRCRVNGTAHQGALACRPLS